MKNILISITIIVVGLSCFLLGGKNGWDNAIEEYQNKEVKLVYPVSTGIQGTTLTHKLEVLSCYPNRGDANCSNKLAQAYQAFKQDILNETFLYYKFIPDVRSGAFKTVRSGAICRDGWRSSATGSGACSSHGGVSYWLY